MSKKATSSSLSSSTATKPSAAGPGSPATEMGISQVAALYLSLRSIATVMSIFVSLSTVPLFLSFACWLLDSLTNDHPVPAVLATTTSIFLATSYVESIAPSPKKATEALSKPTIRVGIIFLSLIISIGSSKLLGGLLQWPVSTLFSASLATIVRLALGCFLLGLSVILRYVGKFSIVRCTSSPVFVNQSKLEVHNYTSTLTVENFADSVRRILWRWRLPKEDPKPQGEPPIKTKPQISMSPGTARRLQTPTAHCMLVQMTLCTFLALFLAFLIVLPFSKIDVYDPDTANTKTSIYTTCVIASLIDLVTSTFPISGQFHHELNPEKYSIQRFFSLQHRTYHGIFNWLLDFLINGDAMTRLLLPTCLTIIIAFTCRTALSDAMFLLVTAYGITLYQAGFEFVLRVQLCSTSNMSHVVGKVVGQDDYDDFVSVAVTSILHSNDKLVQSVRRTPDFITADISSGEQRHHDKDITLMAETLRYKTPADDKAPHLEDDLLRVTTLRSLRNVNQWITTPTSLGGGVSRNKVEESSLYWIPMLRSLCVYIGGLGKALDQCSKDNKVWNDAWLLPPGAIQCAEHALESIVTGTIGSLRVCQTLSWSSNPVAFLIGPRILSAAFQLRTGILAYSKASGTTTVKGNEAESENREVVRSNCPQLLSLYDDTADAALKILDNIATMDQTGIRREVETFSADCDKWIRELSTKIIT